MSGVMTAPQARWLVPHRQEKSKEVGPRGGRGCRTATSQLAGTPPTGPGLTAAWQKRRRQAGPRGNSLAARRPGRSFAATGLSSFASTERRRPPGEAVRSPASPRAIRRSGPKAAAPGKRPPRRRSPLPSPRRTMDMVISPRRRKSSTQKSVALSVCEAEQTAGVLCAQDMLYVQHILESLGLKRSTADPCLYFKWVNGM